jgi:hypothetical protein
MYYRGRKNPVLIAAGLLLAIGLFLALVDNKVLAQLSNDGEFSLSVSPSPIITSVAPGQEKELSLSIRNSGVNSESLKIELRAFSANSSNSEISLSEEAPKEIEGWVKIPQGAFSLKPGDQTAQKIMLTPPKDVGFSYNFALVISRVEEPNDTQAQTTIKGSVAVLTLLSIDRPDATRSLEIVRFESSRSSYDFLPAQFKVMLKNNGNTYVQPYGNVFIQRSENDPNPISVLKLNESGSYLLPNTQRELDVFWRDGFPLYETKKISDNQPDEQVLRWDWSKAENLRFGKYYAKLVAVYNDGQRDVPVEALVSFWVIPWKYFVGLVIAVGIFLVGIVAIFKKPINSIRKRRENRTSTRTS